MDPIDREILQHLQVDASVSARELGALVGLTATPCWRRVRALQDDGVIARQVAVVDPARIGLDVMALVAIRTNDHSSTWIAQFRAAIEEFSEIVEAYRTSGETDYLLVVRVTTIAAFDAFYQRLVDAVPLYDVRSTFVMEQLKHTTELPLDHLT
ncbi:MAG: Lrp/AsnC family transcriptional regulator [Actinomycetota bacterium]